MEKMYLGELKNGDLHSKEVMKEMKNIFKEEMKKK